MATSDSNFMDEMREADRAREERAKELHAAQLNELADVASFRREQSEREERNAQSRERYDDAYCDYLKRHAAALERSAAAAEREADAMDRIAWHIETYWRQS